MGSSLSKKIQFLSAGILLATSIYFSLVRCERKAISDLEGDWTVLKYVGGGDIKINLDTESTDKTLINTAKIKFPIVLKGNQDYFAGRVEKSSVFNIGLGGIFIDGLPFYVMPPKNLSSSEQQWEAYMQNNAIHYKGKVTTDKKVKNVVLNGPKGGYQIIFQGENIPATKTPVFKENLPSQTTLTVEQQAEFGFRQTDRQEYVMDYVKFYYTYYIKLPNNEQTVVLTDRTESKNFTIVLKKK